MSDYLHVALEFHRRYGFNVVPAYGKASFGHEQWHSTPQTKEDIESHTWASPKSGKVFGWRSATGINAICGLGGLTMIDFDYLTYEAVEIFMDHLGVDDNWLVDTPTGNRHLWVVCEDLSRNKMDWSAKEVYARDDRGEREAHIEVRYGSHLGMLPFSSHPDGGTYEFAWQCWPDAMPATVTEEQVLSALRLVAIEPEQKSFERRSAAAPSTIDPSAHPGYLAYAQSAYDQEIDILATTGVGGRNKQLNSAAFNLGQLIQHGLLDRHKVETVLTDIAVAIGLDEAEAWATVQSGINSGIEKTRQLPELRELEERPIKPKQRASQRGKREEKREESSPPEEWEIAREEKQDRERQEQEGKCSSGDCILAILVHNPELIAESGLQSSDFPREEQGVMLEALAALHERGAAPDEMLLASEMENLGSNKQDALYLARLIFAFDVDERNLSEYIRLMSKAARKRLVDGYLRRAISQAEAGDDDQAEAILNEAVEQLAEQSNNKLGGDKIGSVVATVLEGIQGRADGTASKPLPMGFKDLDRLLGGGVGAGNLLVVAGRPGMGKTTFGVQSLYKFPCEGAKLLFTFEMSKEELVQRLLSTVAGVEHDKIRSGEISDDEWVRLYEAAGEIQASNIIIFDDPDLSIEEIRRIIEAMSRRTKVGAVLVDYLQLVEVEANKGKRRDENRQQEITTITRTMKKIARKCNVVFFALSQINRGVENRADKRPNLADLRESGSIEQEADMVLFLYRAGYYDEAASQNTCETIIAKWRHGQTGTVSLFVDLKFFKFGNLSVTRVDWEKDQITKLSNVKGEPDREFDPADPADPADVETRIIYN